MQGQRSPNRQFEIVSGRPTVDPSLPATYRSPPPLGPLCTPARSLSLAPAQLSRRCWPMPPLQPHCHGFTSLPFSPSSTYLDWQQLPLWLHPVRPLWPLPPIPQQQYPCPPTLPSLIWLRTAALESEGTEETPVQIELGEDNRLTLPGHQRRDRSPPLSSG